MEQKNTNRCPVSFNQHSRDHAERWPEIYQDLRANCPRPWINNFGGYWVATRYQDILRIAQQVDAFSTAKTFDPETGDPRGGLAIPTMPARDHKAIPNELDPPEWNGMREMLNPLFGPRAAEARRETTRAFAMALIDARIETGEIDFVQHLTSPLPGMVTMTLLGIEPEAWKLYAEPIHRLARLDRNDAEANISADFFHDFMERVDHEVGLRRRDPREDLFSHLAFAEVNGRPLTRNEIRDIATQILAGGVDSTTALTSGALLLLGRCPEDRRRLREDRSLIPLAREEFLRFITPIHGLARTVKEDIDLDGWQLEGGDRIMLAYASANRDEDIFEDAADLKIDRKVNRHIAFGAGIHRCLGSFLARMMFEEMLNQVLDRVPEYQLIEEEIQTYPTVGGINGISKLPARFEPGERIG